MSLVESVPHIQQDRDFHPVKNVGELIVEVGPREHPAYLVSSAVKKRVRNGGVYLAIDCDQEKLRCVKEEGVGFAVVADLENLPVPNASADQIWMLNVFGQRRHPSYLYGASGFESTFTKLAAGLKAEGELIIGEFITAAHWLKALDYPAWGLEMELYGQERIDEFVTRYSLRPTIPEIFANDGKRLEKEPPFFLVLKKKPNP